jgi:hypothetical protein
MPMGRTCGGPPRRPRVWQRHRACTEHPACCLALTPAACVGQRVTPPHALRLAAALHGHLVACAPAVLAGRRCRIRCLARGSGLLSAGGLLSGQDRLRGLLDDGLHVGRGAHRWDGGG